MQLTKSQNKATISLFDEYIKGERKIIDFCAPTGSGKTFIASNLISRIFALNNSDKFIKTMVIIATVSNAELPKAFAKKIIEYKPYLPLSDFEVEFRESPSSSKNAKIEHIKNFSLENNKVIVFGTSSFGKKKLFTELGLLNSFIVEAKEKDWNIIYIRDEAHKGGATNKDTAESFYKRFDDRMVDLASFTIQMTATPKGFHDLIELKKEDLLDDGVCLLKNELVYNVFQQNTSTSKQLIKEAINKFKDIQTAYKHIDEFIRPALLIQVDSKGKLVPQDEYDQTIDLIKRKLTNANLKYLKYFSGDIEGNAKEDQTLASASKKDSNYDVIIFKVGPATGWDIPRACMLLQIREVSSETLNIQTLGRVKRNPIQGLKLNSITNKYYVYSNYQEGKRSIASYKLKDVFKTLELYQGNLFLDDESKELLENEYTTKVEHYLFESAVSDFIIDNSKHHSLVVDNKEYFSNLGTSNSYKIYVHSIFKLKIWNQQMILENQKYFINGLYKIIDEYAKKLNVAQEIVIYTILHQYIFNLKNIYASCYRKHETIKQYKILPHKELKLNYQMWKSDDDKNKFDISNFASYGYTLIKDINEINFHDIQYLDSSPENMFMEQIIEEINEEGYGNKISFFSKMPTLNSEIYFEYWKSEDSEKHKAYIDFALVYNEKVLMIEVKGWNDYDVSKTHDLLQSFKRYKEDNSSIPIELMICYAGKMNAEIKKPEIKFLDGKGKTKSLSIRKMLRIFFKNS